MKAISLTAILAEGLFALNIQTTPAGTTGFKKSYSGLNNDEIDIMMLGKSFFRIPWVEPPSATTARDGLGPLFNANTCTSCHPNNALGSVYNDEGGISRSMVVRLSIPTDNSQEHQAILKKSGFIPEPTYGAQLAMNGLQSVPYEGKLKITYGSKEVVYPDGHKVQLRVPTYELTHLQYGKLHDEVAISVRKAPALVGLGLLEQLDDATILQNEDVEDANNDGISGKANMVYSIEYDDYRVGRYTYKGSAPTVKHQSAAAFHNDMSLTTTLFPMDNCTKVQEACLKAPKARDKIDVPNIRLDAINFYLTHLKVPVSSKKVTQKVQEGKKLFSQIGCAKCHIPELKTKEGVSVKAYTDLLLHDMGEGLSDGRVEFEASKTEWKTPALWGINSYAKAIKKAPDYLHDGRARSLEEAILWHGGEAENIKEKFMHLNKQQREQIIQFLGTL